MLHVLYSSEEFTERVLQKTFDTKQVFDCSLQLYKSRMFFMFIYCKIYVFFMYRKRRHIL